MTMQLFYFDSLPQMVATSDVVIEGNVQTVEPGRVVGSQDAAIQFAQVTLSVNRLLFGNIDSTSVVIEEYGLESSRPSQVGDYCVYFLHQKTDAPQFYRLVNGQGRFLEDGKGGLVALDDEASWVKIIGGKSLSELESEVEAAARAVAEGRVKPAKPNFWSGLGHRRAGRSGRCWSACCGKATQPVDAGSRGKAWTETCRREVAVGEEQELTFQETLLSDIAEDVGRIRRNTGFLAAVVLVYLVVVGLSFLFVLFANVT